MPAGRRRAEVHPLRKELAEQFRQQVAKMQSSKPELAAKWGLDLRMLYRYLNGSATPTFEVFGRLAAMPELELKLGRRRITTADLIAPKQGPSSPSPQLDLDFGQEAVLRVGGQDVELSFNRKPDGKLVLSVGLARPA